MAPLENVVDPAEPRGLSSEVDGTPDASSSSHSSSSESSSSGNSGSNRNTSRTRGSVGSESGAADLTVGGGDRENQWKGDTEKQGPSGDADAAGARRSEVVAHNKTEDGAGNGGESGSRQSSAAPASSLGSSEMRRRLSGASVESLNSGAGRERPGSRVAFSKASGSSVTAGQPTRAGSTRVAAPGSRVEVRGELRITNVSSSEEVLQLLEDSSSPFDLQLQNVELRVGPGHSVRLGQAVPALREHLMRNLQHQLGQATGPAGDAHRSPNSGSQGRTSANGSRHSSSNIMLTGTVRGTVHPTLLGSRRGGAATAKSAAVSQAEIRRQAAPARGIPSTVHPAASVAAASRPAAVDRMDEAGITSAAAVSMPVSAAAAEQTQQQRVSTEATSLVQQILEVQGQVKSLLAEEGLSHVEAETAALKKKKGSQEDGGNEERLTRRRWGNDVPRGGSMGDDTDSERAARGGAPGSSSSAAASSGSSSSSSGSGGLAGESLLKATRSPQQNDAGAATVKGEVSAGSNGAGEHLKERREIKESVAEDTSHTEDAAARAAVGAGRQTQDEGGGKKESHSAPQEEAKETEGQSGTRGGGLVGQRRLESFETNSTHTKSEASGEAPPREEFKKARAEASHETENAAEGIPGHRQREHIEGAEGEGGSAPVAEEKLSVEKTKEREQHIRKGTQTTATRGTEGATTGDHETPYSGASPAAGKEGGVKEQYSDAVKEDRGDTPGADVRGDRSAEAAGTHPEHDGSAQQVVQGQKQAAVEETLAKQRGVSVPPWGSKEESEGQPSAEQQRSQMKEAGTPPGKKPIISKPGVDRRSSQAGESQEFPMEGDAQERHEGEGLERSSVHESEAQEAATAVAAPTAAPTFVQAFTSLFSWAPTEEEHKPSWT